jgi:hypothetical protein
VPAYGVLAEHQVPIGTNVEDAAAARDEDDALDRPTLADRLFELAEDLLRQTGGAGRVVSSHAERDLDDHGTILAGVPCQNLP